MSKYYGASGEEAYHSEIIGVATGPASPPRFARDDGDEMAERRGQVYEMIDEVLEKLGHRWSDTSRTRVGAVAELLWLTRVLLEDAGDDDAENTIRMAALMARGNGR